MFPWAQSGTPRAVTGQFHKKDSAPEQWNRAFHIGSPPSTPFGVERATPQPSWRHTTLALAMVQWEAQSVLHPPEIFISTRPAHWEVPFLMSRTSVYAGGRRRISATSQFSYLNWVGREVKSWYTSHLNRQLEQLHCGDKCLLDRALWGRTRAQARPLYTWTLQARPGYLALWGASDPRQTQPCHIPALHRWPGLWGM